MTAILVGPAGAGAAGAPGAEGGSAAVWASALAPRVDASMQTSDKERFIWLGNSLVLVGCPDCVSRALAGTLPCALPLAQFRCECHGPPVRGCGLRTRDTNRGHLRNLRTIIGTPSEQRQ